MNHAKTARMIAECVLLVTIFVETFVVRPEKPLATALATVVLAVLMECVILGWKTQ
jgi:hypothetical protein